MEQVFWEPTEKLQETYRKLQGIAQPNFNRQQLQPTAATGNEGGSSKHPDVSQCRSTADI